MPARSEPSITEFAPAANAFTISPEYLIPPSAIIGMPASFAAAEQSSIAVICGTPTPATIRVVHIEPGPIPTLTQSAPAFASARTASLVATLPATTCKSGYLRFIWFTTSNTF